ncbi:MAG: hypothetical protein A2W91_10895 [Bacteroidetes bacterium GWF2_38_335]|nr:MAG: hypothetical protein A2W91_10895 [Bacteroidetes bacterium GWF2_38_335]OFY81792.1 MAG: hypothetical protein A2281_06145 [Bacteroidetes bacterium RIFOXYA12_FULL_38_20]HBS87862.1 hypothetical protein [Bacteroidales bacterium]
MFVHNWTWVTEVAVRCSLMAIYGLVGSFYNKNDYQFITKRSLAALGMTIHVLDWSDGKGNAFQNA